MSSVGSRAPSRFRVSGVGHLRGGASRWSPRGGTLSSATPARASLQGRPGETINNAGETRGDHHPGLSLATPARASLLPGEIVSGYHHRGDHQGRPLQHVRPCTQGQIRPLRAVLLSRHTWPVLSLNGQGRSSLPGRITASVLLTTPSSRRALPLQQRMCCPLEQFLVLSSVMRGVTTT